MALEKTKILTLTNVNCPHESKNNATTLWELILPITFQDKDECRENTHNCSSNSQCENVPGLFRCKCKHGYRQKDNFSCLRVEDCKPCEANTNCIQHTGISGCFCKDADHAKCYDRKNCSLTDPAQKKCKFQCYFWTCKCKPGYVHDSKITSAYICKDINECSIQVGPYANKCGKNTKCENVGGSYFCPCVSSGYVYNHKTTNIIHCTVGGYECPCLSSGFYRVDDFSCAEMEGCRSCGGNSTCVVKERVRGCACRGANPQECLDLGRCFPIPTPKNCYPVCLYRICKCNPGYEFDVGSVLKHDCKDINECRHKPRSSCDHFRKCVNTAGSYECHCKKTGSFSDTNSCRATCPDTWTKSKISRTCVKAFEYRYTWREARKICQRLGGDLVVVLNSQKYKFLKGLLGNEAYWIGASDTRTLGKIMWNERIPVKYPNNFMRDTIEERLRLISHRQSFDLGRNNKT
ncbi:hypothetical protein RRG08_030516 [Elysia crispata]|uniref:Uncharacterized protein n=1 Tax=Elysia crispata TaxID=231223 RepID=A0AAE1B9H1_9GAST|nr:hypothetical protein RRG08_030516 [Elysia crispata]